MNYDLFIPSALVERAVVSAESSERLSTKYEASRTEFDRAESENSARSEEARENQQVTAEQIAGTIAGLNEVFEQANVSLRYRVDSATGEVIVSIVNRDTGETVRQIPTEQILRMRERMREFSGSMFDTMT